VAAGPHRSHLSLGGAATYVKDDPIARFTLLLLLQAQQDRATELVIAPASSARPIRYKVADTWHEMSPPPAHVLPGVMAELGRLAAFSKRPFPKEGLIDVAFGGTRLLWIVRMTSAEADCILTVVEQ
jgi:type II secretory ATPase GspE/PulE/Tfp pilus assembly ATPase PilB-like protein